MPTTPDNWMIFDRALLKRCPACGKGRLFQRYLKQVEACSECGEKLGHIRADDGPAWLTILLTGHIVVPMIFFTDIGKDWPEGKLIAFWCMVAMGLMYLVLPRAKALFIGIIWRTGCSGGE